MRQYDFLQLLLEEQRRFFCEYFSNAIRDCNVVFLRIFSQGFLDAPTWTFSGTIRGRNLNFKNISQKAEMWVFRIIFQGIQGVHTRIVFEYFP